MATRAKIKLPDKTELAIYSEGYPSYILKKIAEDVPLHTLHRAEPYRDSEGRALQINHFDYAYHIKPDVIRVYVCKGFEPWKFHRLYTIPLTRKERV